MSSRNRSIEEFIPLAPYLVVVLIVFILALSGFAWLADEVTEVETLAIDIELLRYINQLSAPWLDNLFIFITWLGDIIFVATAAALTCLVLAKRARQRSAIFMASNIIGSVIISHSLKLLFARQRPDLWQALVTESTFSFPSGHAIASCTLALSICIVLWRTKWRWSAVILGAIYVALVGFSRLYLGIHYPSDVIGGWLISIDWVLIVFMISMLKNNINRS